MICTECQLESSVTTTDHWQGTADGGRLVIIGPGEHLCPACARERTGYRTLQQIHDERKAAS